MDLIYRSVIFDLMRITENEKCLDSSDTIDRKEVNEDWIGIFDSLEKEVSKETFIGGIKI